RRAGLAAAGPSRARSQGQDRASRGGTREPGAPTVCRGGGVARWTRGAGSEGTGSLRLCHGGERQRGEGGDGAARVVGAERRDREDPLRRDAASWRSLSRSLRPGGRSVAGAAARAGLLARAVERAAAQARGGTPAACHGLGDSECPSRQSRLARHPAGLEAARQALVVRRGPPPGGRDRRRLGRLAKGQRVTVTARSRFAVIFFTILIDLIGFGIIIPILPYYAQRLGAGGFGLGALLAVFSG